LRDAGDTRVHQPECAEQVHLDHAGRPTAARGTARRRGDAGAESREYKSCPPLYNHFSVVHGACSHRMQPSSSRRGTELVTVEGDDVDAPRSVHFRLDALFKQAQPLLVHDCCRRRRRIQVTRTCSGWRQEGRVGGARSPGLPARDTARRRLCTSCISAVRRRRTSVSLRCRRYSRAVQRAVARVPSTGG
jgi:hypothetical protein